MANYCNEYLYRKVIRILHNKDSIIYRLCYANGAVLFIFGNTSQDQRTADNDRIFQKLR